MEPAVSNIRVDAIKPSGTNPRKSLDKAQLAELTQSVRAHGVLQPVLVRPNGAAGEFLLVAGERRWRAAKAAGLAEIPALVRELSDAQVLEIQVIENLQRADLHPLEEAQGYQQLLAKKYDVARIAARVGRSPNYVYDRVKLLNLTKEAQKRFLAGEFTTGHAVILARLKPEDQVRAMDEPGALFEAERSLFTPDTDRKERFRDYRKPVSVRELQAYETAATLKQAAETGEKVVRITYDEITPEAARDERPILGRSWKRADGLRGSKQCERSVVGLVVIGPGRSQALRVCTDKKHCSVHWGELIKAAKKREREVSKAATTGEDREELRKKKAAEDEAGRTKRAEQWRRAVPEILTAIASALKKAPAGAESAIGKLLISDLEDAGSLGASKRAAKYVPPGRTAEDLVRHLALLSSIDRIEESWGDYSETCADVKKTFGVDASKLFAAAAAAEPKKAAAVEKKPTPKKPEPKKKAKR